jgi:hypothetical protein
LDKIIHECQLLAELNGYQRFNIIPKVDDIIKESRVTEKDAGTLYNDRTVVPEVDTDMHNPNKGIYFEGHRLACEVCGDYLTFSEKDKYMVAPCCCHENMKSLQKLSEYYKYFVQKCKGIFNRAEFDGIKSQAMKAYKNEEDLYDTDIYPEEDL